MIWIIIINIIIYLPKKIIYFPTPCDAHRAIKDYGLDVIINYEIWIIKHFPKPYNASMWLLPLNEKGYYLLMRLLYVFCKLFRLKKGGVTIFNRADEVQLGLISRLCWQGWYRFTWFAACRTAQTEIRIDFTCWIYVILKYDLLTWILI